MKSNPSPFRVRAFRHGLVTTVLVLLVCGAIATLSLLSYNSAQSRMGSLSARAVGEITAVRDYFVDVRWPLPNGAQVTAPVELAVTPPPVGTRSEVAYEPSNPQHAAIPGAVLLAELDRAASGLSFSAVIAFAAVAVFLAFVLRRVRLTNRPTHKVIVRRVRVQKGLIARSWLETESGPQRWIPVYYDPVLVGMPSPVEVSVHGDPRTDRLLAVDHAGTVLYSSGSTVRTEPQGRRTDNPVRPGEDIEERTAASSSALRQFRADAALIMPAPLVGLFWAYLDAGGFPVWLGATLITAAIALWWAAVRGSDPS
ncbi:DUF3592 domain-containing protein [Allokutzneria sp. NRRL B-24872]|uniref:DUF3592 domain-containing protein n=1 Tax=Allokutzneria sp. NRRL B-24872 TaxID=1137961 RepID=UPI000A3C0839|nr:DUF3592 domain-containing protein [Allokutzneria sp. NRRL B-24872]